MIYGETRVKWRESEIQPTVRENINNQYTKKNEGDDEQGEEDTEENMRGKQRGKGRENVMNCHSFSWQRYK